MLDKVFIGKSDIHVFPIGLGTNAVGGHNLYPCLNDDNGKNIVRTALNNGIEMLDTAYAYGFGRSEELIGEVLTEYQREKIIVGTKAAHKKVKNDIVFDNHPDFLIQAVEDSLKRLQTDYLDIFYIHYPDGNTPEWEAVGALQRLKEEGKIRAIGVSNFSMEQLKNANKDGFVDIVEDEYNLLTRANEKSLMDYSKKESISFIPFFPLASGLLTGKYTASITFPKDDLRNSQPNFNGNKLKENITKVNLLKPIAKKYNVEVNHIVLAWYLQRSDIDLVIPGAKNSQQVMDNLRTEEVQLSGEDWLFIDHLFS